MIFQQALLRLSAWHLRVSSFPWAVLIALVVLALAHVIKYFVNTTVEDDKAYRIIIIAFLAIYLIAAIAVGALNPAAFAAS